MNFLAHLFLSGDDQDLMIGNFIADAVKGNSFNNYREGISKGIRLHRFIDSFTDTHEGNRELFAALRKDFGRYSGVAVDIYYDHFLASQWSNYSDEDLEEYCQKAYAILHENRELFPDRVRFMLKYLRRDDWLTNYRLEKGVDFAFRGMSRRIPHDNNLHQGLKVLLREYDMIGAAFQSFFPELQNGCANQIKLLDLKSGL